MSVFNLIERFLSNDPFPFRGEGSKESIIFQYGRPNLFKEVNLFHIHSAIYGNSIKALMAFNGNRVSTDIGITDIGRQTGITLYGFTTEFKDQKTKLEKASKSDTIHRLYYDVFFGKFNDGLVEELSLLWQESQTASEEFKQLKHRLHNTCFQYIQNVFETLNISFEHHLTKDKLFYLKDEILALMKEKNLLCTNEGNLSIIPQKEHHYSMTIRNKKGLYSQNFYELLFLYYYARYLKKSKTIFVLSRKHQITLMEVNNVLNRMGISHNIDFYEIGNFPQGNQEHIYNTCEKRYFVFSDIIKKLEKAFSDANIKESKALGDDFILKSYIFYVLGHARDEEFLYNFNDIFDPKQMSYLRLLHFLEQLPAPKSGQISKENIQDTIEVKRFFSYLMKFQAKVQHSLKRKSVDGLIRYIFKVIAAHEDLIPRIEEHPETKNLVNHLTKTLIDRILNIIGIDHKAY